MYVCTWQFALKEHMNQMGLHVLAAHGWEWKKGHLTKVNDMAVSRRRTKSMKWSTCFDTPPPSHLKMCCSQTAHTSYKVLISALCYFYPLEVAVMLSQITVVVCPEIDLTPSKLGWYFPLSGALKNYGILSVCNIGWWRRHILRNAVWRCICA